MAVTFFVLRQTHILCWVGFNVYILHWAICRLVTRWLILNSVCVWYKKAVRGEQHRRVNWRRCASHDIYRAIINHQIVINLTLEFSILRICLALLGPYKVKWRHSSQIDVQNTHCARAVSNVHQISHKGNRLSQECANGNKPYTTLVNPLYIRCICWAK